MADGKPGAAPNEGGVVGSAKGMLSAMVGAAETRLQILGAEIQEERIRLTRLVLWGTAGLYCVFLGIALLAMFLVVLLWDTHRLAVLGLLSGVFLGAGVAIGIGVAAIARGSKATPLSQTRDVLARDRELLESGK